MADDNLIPTNNGTGDSIQCPVLPNDDFDRLGSAGSIDTTGKSYISFDADSDGLKINKGSSLDSSNYFTMGPGYTYGIGTGLTSVYVNGSVGYILW
jgi:hypothetical protein